MKNLSCVFLVYLALSVLVLESAQAKSFKGPELYDNVDYKAPHRSLDRLISYFKVQNDRLLAGEALLLKDLFLVRSTQQVRTLTFSRSITIL